MHAQPAHRQLFSYQQNERVQYDSCNCTAGGQTCAESQLIASLCLAQSADFPRVSININRNSGMLNSVLEYVPGDTYYFTSKKGLPMSQPGPMSKKTVETQRSSYKCRNYGFYYWKSVGHKKLQSVID